MNEFSQLLIAIHDRMHVRILQMERRVLPGLAKYGVMTHMLKEELQKGAAMRQREFRLMDDLQRMQTQTQADASVQQRHQKAEVASAAATDSRLAHEQILHQADAFEKQKLLDLRNVLLTFCTIELAFHSKVSTQLNKCMKKMP